MVDKSLD